MDWLKSLYGILTGCVVTAVATHWGKSPEALRGAAVGAAFLLVSDTMLGVVYAVQSKRFSSFGLRKFFSKTLVYFAVLLAAVGIDQVFRSGDFAQMLVVFMICISEASSVFETSQLLGFKWPKALTEKFAALEQVCEDVDNAAALIAATGGQRDGSESEGSAGTDVRRQGDYRGVGEGDRDPEAPGPEGKA